MIAAKDFMSPQVIGISQKSTVKEAAELLKIKKVSGIIVTHDKFPIGIITERDIVNFVALGGDPNTTLIESVMSAPVRIVDATEPINQVIIEMTETKFKRLPVAENNQLIGIISQTDILRNFVRIGHEIFGKFEKGEISQQELTDRHKAMFLHLEPISSSKSLISWHMCCQDCKKSFFVDEIDNRLVNDKCPHCGSSNIMHVK